MSTPLQTETNTRTMERRVLRAARAVLFEPRSHVKLTADEHGQWWVTNVDNGGQWSVHDATGGASFDGFDFERVSP